MLELLTICDQSLEQEEMLLNVVAALTNLTYYSCQVIAIFIAISRIIPIMIVLKWAKDIKSRGWSAAYNRRDEELSEIREMFNWSLYSIK